MARSTSRPPGSGLTTLQALAIASQFGVTLAVAVGLGLVAGHWLDGVLRTSFVFTLIGVLLGLAAASAGTVRIYRSTLQRTTREPPARATKPGPTPADDDHTEG